MSNIVITAPTLLPVSVENMKKHLNEPSDTQDALIESYIASAAEEWESKTQHALMLQTREETLDEFPASGWIRLDYPPIVSIESIKYFDADGIEQTLSSASYRLDRRAHNESGWVVLGANSAWPQTYDMINAISVRYVCGYPDAESVPHRARQWVRMVVGHWYANREAVNIGNISGKLDFVDSLLDGFRVY